MKGRYYVIGDIILRSGREFNIDESTTIGFELGDITDQEVDAIINAANSSLMGGGGVDGAIHSRGGPAILRDCQEIRRNVWKTGLPAGEAVITSGGNLKTRHVIHTVGPIWGGSQRDASTLRSCYQKCLSLAESHRLQSIAFPSISTGAYGYPIREASLVAIRSVLDHFGSSTNRSSLELVVFVLFTERDLAVYLESGERLIRDQKRGNAHDALR